ncbi:DUF6049 family protein [Actinocrispum wychmicini]|uniref:Glycoprotein n=1 Tax=Actinocrispum wychmicini TaxID=1213861 RepID=A0A4R2JW59_9PSEU|nr:DUF6049 family protein [Actinocrispum wychmicini]TCO64683.1 hypothetical protein EV192_101465 [Actinocrispum wychmicini]
MSRVRSATHIVLAALAAGAFAATGSSAAAQQPPTALEPLVAPIGLAPPQPADTPSRVRLDVNQLAPRVIRTEGAVTVSGRLTNTSDRRIEDIEIRLQRGDPITNDGKLRDAMRQAPAAELVKPQFQPVRSALDPGASTDFTFSTPVDSLKVDQPGVYPVLINVNGRPAYGGVERLAGLNILLPVLRGAAPPGKTAGVTVLWPLVDDHPRVVQQVVNGKAVLTDDDLSTSLSVGGRLFGMLNAVEIATKDNQSLPSSICFAVDGDLLATVKSMSEGYQVLGPTGQAAPGRGRDAAQRWLDNLRQLTKGQCVIALPYADADLSALSRAGVADLTKIAVEQGFAKVAEVLQPVQPQQNVLWPADGTLDQRVLTDIAGNPVTVLTNPDRLKGVAGSAPFAFGQRNRAVPIDQLTSLALAGNASGPVSVQNGLAALVFRTALQPGQSVLVAPPRRWTAPASELTTFLQTVSRLYTDKLAAPQVFQGLATESPAGTASGVDYPQQDAATELTGPVLTDISQSHAVERDLFGTMRLDDTFRKDPDDLISPIRTGLLRAASNSWRANPDGALRMSRNVGDQLDAMRGQITVSPPGPPITLASSDSPLPIRIGNGLPVAVYVRFVVSESAGIKPVDIPERRIQANGSATVFIRPELQRAGKFTVDVSLTTLGGGVSLGTTQRFELSSTSYGTITVAVTSVAGGALVLLVGRRIYRRNKQSKSAKEQSPA